MRKLWLLFLLLCWLSLVTASAYFAMNGLETTYPGSPLAFGVTDIQALGVALVIGQYSAIHIGIELIFRKDLREKIIGSLAMLLAIVLSVSNISFAYVSISQKHTTTQVVDVAADNRVQLINDQIKDLKGQRKSLEATVSDIPEKRVTQRIKQQRMIQPRLDDIDSQVTKLQNDLITLNSQQAEIKGAAAGSDKLNKTFGIFGMEPGTVIAWLLAISIDPLAVIVMMSLTAYARAMREDDKLIKEKNIATVHQANTEVRAKPKLEPLRWDDTVRKPHEVVVQEETDPVKVVRLKRNG